MFKLFIKDAFTKAKNALIKDVKEAVRLYFLPVTAIFKAYREEFKRMGG